MADIHKNPNDSVDLSLLLASYGESIGTFYPVAYVYDPQNNLVNGSPFTLSLVANNLYVLNNAFQCQVDSGTYKVVYIIYTDAGHTIRSADYSEWHDTITVSIQASSGLGGNSGGTTIYYNDDKLKKYLKDNFDKLEKKIKKLQKDFDDGLSVKVETGDILAEINKLSTEIKDGNVAVINNNNVILRTLNNFNPLQILQSLKKTRDDLLIATKKNRSVIIKNKFDKALLQPIINTLAIDAMDRQKVLKDIKIDLTNTLDMKTNQIMVKFGKIFEVNNNYILEVFQNLDNSLRKKLKYSLEQIHRIVTYTRAKQNINIILKKDE